jgi:large conductance mechanosensitive channel
MLSGFKKFILRGNVVDMAVGVVIGAAFGGVVTALTKDPPDSAHCCHRRQAGFSAISFKIGETLFPLGDFINALVSFLLVAAAVYFFVVTPVNALMAKFKDPEAPTTKACPQCLSEIPLAAKRCSHCTQPV